MTHYQPSDKIGCCDMWSIEKDGVWYTYHLQVPFPSKDVGQFGVLAEAAQGQAKLNPWYTI